MPAITFILDANVDTQLDTLLRDLFGICFTGPNNEIFKARRYFHDAPKFRWIMQDPSGAVIAHAAAHEKTLVCEGAEIPICGIAEVCVHPSHRKQGYVGSLLKVIHAFMQDKGIRFSVLSGETYIYESSGYRSIHNLVYTNNGKIEPFPKAMALALGSHSWPEDPIYLQGNFF